MTGTALWVIKQGFVCSLSTLDICSLTSTQQQRQQQYPPSAFTYRGWELATTYVRGKKRGGGLQILMFANLLRIMGCVENKKV